MNQYSKMNAYKEMEVNSVNRLKIVLMVYDAAIGSVKYAITCHKRNDIVKRNRSISRAQFIINELNNSLNMQHGKEIADSLRKLYYFLNRSLNDALSQNDEKKLEDSLSILMNLKEAWEEITDKGVVDEPTINTGDQDGRELHKVKGLDQI